MESRTHAPGSVPPRGAAAPACPPRAARRPGPRARLALALLLAAALLGVAGCRSGDQFTSEGTPSAPVQLAIPTVARNSTVGGSSSSYYSATPVTAGGTIVVSVSQLTADADLGVFSDSGYTQTLCADLGTGGGSLSCSYTVAASSTISTIYIQVKGTAATGSSFQLTIQE